MKRPPRSAKPRARSRTKCKSATPPRESGVDRSLLAYNLRLTPTERLRNNQQMVEFIQHVRQAGRRL